MLTSLHISNYALIEHLDLTLDEGFSVITGETGAGKSIILGALGLLQGNRADTKVIKTGEKKCVVEGTFTIDGLAVRGLLDDADIDSDDDTIIIRREISANGKSRAFINDTPTTLTTIKDVSARLIDIHSQHQNLLLAGETFIIDTLDSVGGHSDLLTAYGEAYRHWQESERTLRTLREAAEASAADRDFMAFQLQQLDEAAVSEGELASLEEEQQTLAHAEDIKAALSQTAGILRSDDTDIVAALRQAVSALSEAGAYLPSAEDLAERLESARIEVDDILSEVEGEADGIDFDPRRLEYVDDRIGTIYDLLKRHRVETVEALLAKGEDLRRRLDAIDNADDNIARQEAVVKAARKNLSDAAARLTEARRKAAKEVEDTLIESMHGLGMPHAQIVIDIERRQRPERYGFDTLRFLFSANKAVAPHDIATTASGGEIARLMLALKALIVKKKAMPTIVFDEIDTGVSGTMAERMGHVMKTISDHTQVLCITHLPQIAALGSHHFRVYKKEDEEGTTSHLVPLSAEERITEIANMLSGAQLTPEALANAKTLLNP